jgi:hypothetical protein
MSSPQQGEAQQQGDCVECNIFGKGVCVKEFNASAAEVVLGATATPRCLHG